MVSSGKCSFWKLWAGMFDRWSRLYAARMAALHAAVLVSCAPPAAASMRAASYRNDCRKRKIADVACRGSTCSQFVLRAVSLRM